MLLATTQIADYSDKRVMIPISGGINSAAALIFYAEFFPDEYKSDTLYLFYSHLIEHSPFTLRFVRDLIAYARKKFKKVICGFSRASVNEYFLSQKKILSV